jgi:hypothetical protein
MNDMLDPKLMKEADQAFWVEMNSLREDAWEEGGVRRYIVREASVVKVIVTDANIRKERKIVV